MGFNLRFLDSLASWISRFEMLWQSASNTGLSGLSLLLRLMVGIWILLLVRSGWRFPSTVALLTVPLGKGRSKYNI